MSQSLLNADSVFARLVIRLVGRRWLEGKHGCDRDRLGDCHSAGAGATTPATVPSIKDRVDCWLSCEADACAVWMMSGMAGTCRPTALTERSANE